MRPIHVNSNKNISAKNKEKDSKSEVGDHVKIWKYKNIFAKDSTPNWSQEFSLIKRVQNTVSWIDFISDLNGEEIFGTIIKKTSQAEFIIEKVVKKKDDRLYLTWKRYNN